MSLSSHFTNDRSKEQQNSSLAQSISELCATWISRHPKASLYRLEVAHEGATSIGPSNVTAPASLHETSSDVGQHLTPLPHTSAEGGHPAIQVYPWPKIKNPLEPEEVCFNITAENLDSAIENLQAISSGKRKGDLDQAKIDYEFAVEAMRMAMKDLHVLRSGEAMIPLDTSSESSTQEAS